MTISHQFVSLVVMFCSGLAIGAIIDAFRISMHRTNFTIKKYSAIIEIVLWSMLGILTFCLLYFVKFGVWRYVDPLAQFIGIIVYDLLLKELGRIIGRVLFILFIKPILWVGFLVFSLIRGIIKILMKIVMFFINPIKKLIGKFCKILLKKR